MDEEKSGPSKGRFFCVLTQFLTLASAIAVGAVACDCAPMRPKAVFAVVGGPGALVGQRALKFPGGTLKSRSTGLKKPAGYTQLHYSGVAHAPAF